MMEIPITLIHAGTTACCLRAVMELLTAMRSAMTGMQPTETAAHLTANSSIAEIMSSRQEKCASHHQRPITQAAARRMKIAWAQNMEQETILATAMRSADAFRTHLFIHATRTSAMRNAATPMIAMTIIRQQQIHALMTACAATQARASAGMAY
jgi:hypothetical protein